MKRYQNLNQVPEKYKFDLEDILQGHKIGELFEQFILVSNEVVKVKDSKYESINNYLDFLKLAEKMNLISNKINNYINNNLNRNLADSYFQELEAKWEKINDDFNLKNGSEINRFAQNVEKIKTWIEDPRLKNYRKKLLESIGDLKHKLEPNVEEYINQTALANPDFETIFNTISDSELDYGFVLDSKGKKYKLNHISRIKFLKSKDKTLRKNTYKNYLKAYLKRRESLSSLLFQHFRTLVVQARTRKFNSTVEMLTYSDHMNEDLLISLFKKVSKLKYSINKFAKYHKKFYEAKFKEKFDPKYDSQVELVKVKTNYSIEQAKEIILKAFNCFEGEYYETLKKALNERWIDFMSIENKISGAYSVSNAYGIDKKYILMNFDSTIDSLETMAHELGHSMHTYFADKNNDIFNSEYPIFLAEIASIFHEQIFYNYLYKTSRNEKFKFKVLDSMITGFIGTVFRQVQWANYEFNLYKAVEKKEANQSYEYLAKLYFDSLEKFRIKKVKFDKNKQIAAISVPHFYYGFYVYKYAIGQLVACYFFSKYQKEGKEFLKIYIDNFLSVGNRNLPLETLLANGVNLLEDAFYEEGFSYFKNLINEWIELGKKIFKVK